ncbi:MAG: acyltransferase family protein [Candidatus Sedimenticola sp. 20ELBAFRAG]
MNKNKSFFNWVLIAKGIGIVLVVVGHFYPKNSPEYWSDIRDIIYTFHMPLFFLLSGFLYSYTKHTYSVLINGKVKRLIYPFISIAILFFVIKYLSGLFFYLENPVGLESVYALLTNPIDSYMPLLWFVHALFLIFLIYPLTRNLIGNNFIILIIFILINVVFGNDYIFFGKALANVPFFIIGVILRENTRVRDAVITDKWFYVGVPLMIFCFVYLAKLNMDSGNQIDYIFRLVLGVTGTICIINMSSLIDANNKGIGKLILTEIGIYSMTIYLFHTLFESAVRIGFQQVLGDFQVSFEIVAFTAVIAGIVFPLLLEKIFLRNNMITKKYILGLA